MKFLVYLLLLSLSFGSTMSPSSGQEHPIDSSQLLEACQSLQSARLAERSADLHSAAERYRTAISYAQHAYTPTQLPRVKLLGEPLSSIGRRAIALQLKLLQKSNDHNSQRLSREQALSGIERLYKTMEFVEPDNPAWPYLSAIMYSSVGNYYDAFPALQQCLRTKSGDPAVRAKAQKLLVHITPGYQAQFAQVQADKARYQQYVQSGQQWRDIARVSFNCERQRILDERSRR